MVDNRLITGGLQTGKTEEEIIAVVCDGVGGTNGGEVAAQIAASGFIDFDVKNASAYTLIQHIHGLNSTIIDAQKQRCTNSNMASTAAGIMIWKNRYLMFNLGDTRIYEFCDNSFSQKTRDSVLEQNRVENGQAIRRKYLTSYLGGPGYSCKPDIIRGHISESESYFLICSDGLYKGISGNELSKALSKKNTLKQKLKDILSMSTQSGSTDDQSLVLIKYSS